MPKGIPIKMKKRALVAAGVLIFLCFGFLGWRLWSLQIIDADNLKEAAVNQQLRDTTIRPNRGTITDTNGAVLAESATVWTVYVSPKELEVKNDPVKTDANCQMVADRLAEILEIDRDTLYGKIQNTSQYYVIAKRQIESDVREKILQLRKEVPLIAKSVGMDEDSKRYYPYGDFASVVLGFVGYDNQGLAGLESYYDKYLQGTPGRVLTAKNAVGTDMNFEYSIMEDAEDGNNLQLTIDEGVQHFLEKHVQQAVEDNNVTTYATGIVMIVKTFEILGMTVLPGYDPNNPFALSEEVLAEIALLPEEEQANAKIAAQSAQWRNNAISDSYEPGSVFKVVTASAALDEGSVTLNNTFSCHGVYQVPGTPVRIRCVGSHGLQTFTEALQNSCNPAFIQVGALLGKDAFIRYYKSYGLTEKTGIDLPGEMQPIAGVHYQPDEQMGVVELASSSFGQTRKVSALQMISAVAAAVNGGYMGTPHIVEKITDADGNVIETFDAGIKRQVISEETSKVIAQMLESVVTKGGGKNAQVPGYRVGGKTGTSEKLDTGDGSGRVASFCGFAPVDDPQIACIVVIDEPHTYTSFGSQLAAPVFKNIMEEVLPYLGVEKTGNVQTTQTASVPKVIGASLAEAKEEIAGSNLKYKVVGGGDTVLAQLPDPGTELKKDGLVVLYTDEDSKTSTVKVPNLVGFSASQVNQYAASAGVNVRFSGNPQGAQAKSIKQSIAPETLVSPGTIIDVEFVTSANAD